MLSSIFTGCMSLISGLSLPLVKNWCLSQALVTLCGTVVLKYIYFSLKYPQKPYPIRYFMIDGTAVVDLCNI